MPSFISGNVTLHLTNCDRNLGIVLKAVRGVPKRSKYEFLHNVALKVNCTPEQLGLQVTYNTNSSIMITLSVLSSQIIHF